MVLILFIYLDQFDWNSFFQVVVLFAGFPGDVIIPSIFILYIVIMEALGINSDEVSNSNDLNKLLTNIGGTHAYEVFTTQDQNLTYPIPMEHFYEVLINNDQCYYSLNLLQNTLYERILGLQSWEDILKRRFDIPDIREYRKTHNGKSPPENICNRLIRAIQGRPHPYIFDYEVQEDQETPCIEYILTIFKEKYKVFIPPPEMSKKNSDLNNNTNNPNNPNNENELPLLDLLPLTIVDHTTGTTMTITYPRTEEVNESENVSTPIEPFNIETPVK